MELLDADTGHNVLNLTWYPHWKFFRMLRQKYPDRIPRQAIVELLIDLDEAILLQLPNSKWPFREKILASPSFMQRVKDFRTDVFDLLRCTTATHFIVTTS